MLKAERANAIPPRAVPQEPSTEPAGGRLEAAAEDGSLGADKRECGGSECGVYAQPGEAGGRGEGDVRPPKLPMPDEAELVLGATAGTVEGRAGAAGGGGGRIGYGRW